MSRFRRILETYKSVSLIFSEGNTPKSVRGTTANVVFDEKRIGCTFTVSNCVIVPGKRLYGTLYLTDFYGAVGDKLKLTENNKLDCETFYFLKDYNKDGNSVSTDLSSGILWAYTFTGWYIKDSTPLISLTNSSTYIPAQTVFQPGDVITKDILIRNEIIDENGVSTGKPLQLEALWSKCYFLKTGGSDSYTGNDVSKPKASAKTIADIFKTNNAYASVAMLVGDYSFSQAPNDSYYAITYKSLQKTDGSRYTLKSAGTGQPVNYGNWRIDNVIASKTANRSLKSGGNVSYVETTARFSGCLGQLVRYENLTQNCVFCLNGGTVTSGEVFGYATTSTFSSRYFYFGRNIKYNATFYCSCSGSNGSVTGDCYVYVTGGYIATLKGTVKSTNTYSGKRYFYVYGNRTGDNEYDPVLPDIRLSDEAYLDGDAMLYINGSSNLVNVFGGGYLYTSEMNNVYLYIYNSYISGNVYAGGYGDVLGVCNTEISNSTIRGNVYGSAVGKTSEWTISVGNNQANMATIPSGFPVYYATAQTNHPQYSVFGIAENQMGVWGGDYSSSQRNYNVMQFNYYLYTPTTNKCNLTIKYSVIGSTDTICSSEYGNIYNGGCISKVTNDSNLTIIKSTIYSNIYNGGDGVTAPDVAIIDTVVSSANYKQPDGSQFSEEKNINFVYQHPSHLYYTEYDYINGEHYGKEYNWSDDITILNDNGGIDDTNRLVYSPYMSNWGDSSGNNTLTISQESTIYGNVYCCGNKTIIAGNSTVNINNSTINGTITKVAEGSTISGTINITVDGKRI